MLGSILVPLDGSAYAEQALGHAIHIARCADGHLTLCRVHSGVESGFADATIEDDTAVLSHVEEYMGVRARRLTQEFGRPVSHRIEEGSPATALTRVAREIGANLIVLTTHGHGGLSHAWLGGTVEGLVRRAGAPLFLLRPTVPGRDIEPDYQRVLVPLDGSVTAEIVLGPAVEFAGLFGAELKLVAIVGLPVELPARAGEEPVRVSGTEDPEQQRDRALEYLGRVADRLHGRGVHVEVEVREAIRPATAILQAAAEFDADAIAMATHGRTRLRRRPVGSVSDKVIRAAGVPVLLVPSREVETNRPRRRAAAAAA